MRKKSLPSARPENFQEKNSFKVALSAVPRNKKCILPLTVCWWLHGGGNGGGGGDVADHRIKAAGISAVLPTHQKKARLFHCQFTKAERGERVSSWLEVEAELRRGGERDKQSGSL